MFPKDPVIQQVVANKAIADIVKGLNVNKLSNPTAEWSILAEVEFREHIDNTNGVNKSLNHENAESDTTFMPIYVILTEIRLFEKSVISFGDNFEFCP